MSDLSYEEIHDALYEARERITDRRRWMGGAYIGTVEINFRYEKCYCAVGALCDGRPAYVRGDSINSTNSQREFQVMNFFVKHCGVDLSLPAGDDPEEKITRWNDWDNSAEHHAEVLAAFDRAIVVALGLLLDEWVCTWEALRTGSSDREHFWDGNLCYVCAQDVRHPSHRPAGRPWQCPLGLRAHQADDIRRWRGEPVGIG